MTENILHQFIENETVLACQVVLKNVYGPELNKVVLSSNADTTSKHTPQVVRKYCYCPQKTMENQRRPSPNKSPIEFRDGSIMYDNLFSNIGFTGLISKVIPHPRLDLYFQQGALHHQLVSCSRRQYASLQDSSAHQCDAAVNPTYASVTLA